MIYYDGLNDLHESTVNNKNCELCSLRKFKCLVSGSSIHMTVYMFCAGALKDPFLFLSVYMVSHFIDLVHSPPTQP